MHRHASSASGRLRALGKLPLTNGSIAIPKINEREFYLSRAEAEQTMAKNATDPRARDAHQRMADDYNALVSIAGVNGSQDQHDIASKASHRALKVSADVLRNTASTVKTAW